MVMSAMVSLLNREEVNVSPVQDIPGICRVGSQRAPLLLILSHSGFDFQVFLTERNLLATTKCGFAYVGSELGENGFDSLVMGYSVDSGRFERS